MAEDGWHDGNRYVAGLRIWFSKPRGYTWDRDPALIFIQGYNSEPHRLTVDEAERMIEILNAAIKGAKSR